MTTFQDPQPQSRRAVRQSERDDSAESPVGFTQFPAQLAAAAAPQYYADQDAQRDMWDTNARRAAQLPASPAARSDAAAPGRRAAAGQQPAAAEPLNYSTASRQSANPSYDPQSFRSRLDARQAQPEVPQPQTEEQSSFRVRDFSPEGRRAAQAAERAAAPQAWPSATPATDLHYQTEVREGFGAPQVPAAPPAPISQVPPQYAAPVVQQQPQSYAAPQQYSAPKPSVAPQYAAPTPSAQPQAEQQWSDAPGEQTLSRRELRALLAQDEASALDTQQPAVQDAFSAPAAWPAQQQQPELSYEATRIPEVVMPPAPQPSTNAAMTNALAEFDALTGAEPAEATWTPPVGHWSTQADVDDEFPETTINRRVGSGSTATSALVLPMVPNGDIRGPLTSTGEIMLTGSIDLPHSLSSTGATDRFEHDGIDAMFDMSDREVISTDSAPVRAVSAVSTHQTGHGVTHTQKPKGTRALTALLISASSMAVVVAGLLVAAFAFKIF
jgi:hypothetical protein